MGYKGNFYTEDGKNVAEDIVVKKSLITGSELDDCDVNGVYFTFGDTAPTSETALGKGVIYLHKGESAVDLYINIGDANTPNWKKFTRAT